MFCFDVIYHFETEKIGYLKTLKLWHKTSGGFRKSAEGWGQETLLFLTYFYGTWKESRHGRTQQLPHM